MDARRSVSTAVAVACLLAACHGYAQTFTADGETPRSAPAVRPAARAAAFKSLFDGGALSIVLPPPEPSEKAAFQQPPAHFGQPMPIGFGRPVPAPFAADVQPFLRWIREPDGSMTAAFTVSSPGARAVRLGIDATGLVDGTELYFFGVDSPEQEFGPTAVETMRMGDKTGPGNAARGLYWSPVVEGETIRVLVRLASPPTGRHMVVAIPAVSHLVQSPLTGDGKIGKAGSCNIDVRCSNASDVIRAATARLVFTDGGTTFLCTGTLLSDTDPDSVIPYLLTANHCISRQSVASTLNTFWFFERLACGSADLAPVVQDVNGGELLATGTGSDFAFIQLDDDVGAVPGIGLAGWDSSPLGSPATVVTVHHPGGDVKKWSSGTHTGFSDFPGNVNGVEAFERVVWSMGVTEGGSSGGALFDASDRVRGQLKGGGSSCERPGEPDYFGRFDLSFPSVRQWLNEGAAVLTSGDAVSDSVQHGHWKNYKIVAAAGGQLGVELSGLSQDADLYVRAAVGPTRTRFDCRSFLAGPASESCLLATGAAGVYYIGVYGFDAGTTSFTLRATVAPTSLVAAVLPGSRSVQVNHPATAFATILASGSGTATECAITPTNAPPGTAFAYQQTDAANVAVGVPNTPATIPAGGSQSFVIMLVPGQPFGATEVHFAFDCANTFPAPDFPGVNTLLLTSSAVPTPDIVALGATPTNDGIVNIPGPTGTGVLAVASVNVGAASAIMVTADTGSAALPVALALCQTNPVSGACINPATPGLSATLQINAGETPTFTLFAQGKGTVPFSPAVNRVFMRFRTLDDAIVGATSAALRTQ